jgi:hypothetical protein
VRIIPDLGAAVRQCCPLLGSKALGLGYVPSLRQLENCPGGAGFIQMPSFCEVWPNDSFAKMNSTWPLSRWSIVMYPILLSVAVSPVEEGSPGQPPLKVADVALALARDGAEFLTANQASHHGTLGYNRSCPLVNTKMTNRKRK